MTDISLQTSFSKSTGQKNDALLLQLQRLHGSIAAKRFGQITNFFHRNRYNVRKTLNGSQGEALRAGMQVLMNGLITAHKRNPGLQDVVTSAIVAVYRFGISPGKAGLCEYFNTHMAREADALYTYKPMCPPVWEREQKPWRDLRPETNCLTYAANIPFHGKGFPGHLKARGEADLQDTEVTVEGMLDLLIRDGFEFVGIAQPENGNCHVMAALVQPGKDFHFLRRNRDGYWSHKTGEWNPCQIDAQGYRILNPARASFPSYEKFVGYFVIPEKGIQYYPRLENVS